ncbi:MAG: EAL domain-containing protein [Ruminococcaceae bacterium]|nr:EAL domain-containing protein [Oscillospiraceae bacterium]
MIFIGDYFALGLVFVLVLFFFDSKISVRYMTVYSKLFISALLMTAITALMDLFSGYLMQRSDVPLWLHMLANTLFFITAIVTTSLLALYLFRRILQHTHRRHCMLRAYIGLSIMFAVYMILMLINLKTGWIFYFQESGVYCRGPLNSLGYIITLLQLVLVIVCFVQNRQTSTNSMRHVLVMISPVIPLCAMIHVLHPDIMLNSFILALVDTVLFLTFQGQRQGVHSLTQLNDRHRFFSEISHRIPAKEPFQVFLIHVKNYGAINQKYGNKFGDEILYQFALSLEKLLSGGMTFHMNGTVFAVVLRYTSQSTSEKQCGTLLHFLEKGIQCAEHQIDLDYFVAHYVSEDEEQSGTDLYEMLEYAVHKTQQQNLRYIRCGYNDTLEVRRRRYLIERLQTIDREHGFDVWYQPTKCLSTGKFCSMEALIRLHEPDGKMISPGEFIPVAEQTGQISSVTWFVLEEICNMLKSHSELDGVSVSLNMPQTQLLEKGFIPRFTATVDRAGIDRRRICIEFTERAILENFRQTQSVMEELTQSGFRFFLDDFGVNYSNFNCLLQLPFQVIKLDSCLVHPDKDGNPDYTTLQTLTELFHAMNLVVIAEGAETQEDVQNLARHGVDRIQGFALARPMPTDKLLEFYVQHPN